MYHNLSSKQTKKVVSGTLSATAVGALAAASALTAQADGSSSAGGGGGTSNSSRAQDSGQLGSASPSISGGSTSSTGRNSDGRSGTGSGGSSGGSSSNSTGAGLNGFSMSNVSYADWATSVTNMGMTVDGFKAAGPDGSWSSFSPNGEGGVGQSSGSSTPFLSTWNGKTYEFDNDFLFGKPETSFDTYAEGVTAYKAGQTGSDSYLLKNQPKPLNGVLKFQIKEIEPEESFIDTFKLVAVDMPKDHYPVSDGNLKDTYIFNTTKTQTLDNQTAKLYLAKTKTVADLVNGYDTLGPTVASRKDTTLEAGDAIAISLPIRSSYEGDVFLLVDSYFRDWALGNQVPFSKGEIIWMQALKTVKAMPALGLALVMGLFGVFSKETNADYPRYSQSGYGGGGGFSQTGYNGGWTGGGRRSLVITAKVGDEVVYLQTLFPRYVQASQEVVRIPAELLKKAVGGVLEVWITATKKHKVRTAFLFTGKATDEDVTFTELEMTSAIKTNTNTDYASDLNKKDGNFLHTIPADVISVEIKDAPYKEGYTRHYLLKADGFYTKMSKHTKDLMGDKWYARLDTESRKLLRNLRVYKS